MLSFRNHSFHCCGGIAVVQLQLQLWAHSPFAEIFQLVHICEPANLDGLILPYTVTVTVMGT
jgi:hypothetical protein